MRGYYGPASGAIEGFRRLSNGLDMATLSVGTARGADLATTKDLIHKFRPEVLRG